MRAAGGPCALRNLVTVPPWLVLRHVPYRTGLHISWKAAGVPAIVREIRRGKWVRKKVQHRLVSVVEHGDTNKQGGRSTVKGYLVIVVSVAVRPTRTLLR